jgi:hypothetical protein
VTKRMGESQLALIDFYDSSVDSLKTQRDTNTLTDTPKPDHNNFLLKHIQTDALEKVFRGLDNPPANKRIFNFFVLDTRNLDYWALQCTRLVPPKSTIRVFQNEPDLFCQVGVRNDISRVTADIPHNHVSCSAIRDKVADEVTDPFEGLHTNLDASLPDRRQRSGVDGIIYCYKMKQVAANIGQGNRNFGRVRFEMLNDQMVVFAKYCLILGQELRGDWKIICYHSGLHPVPKTPS